MDLATRTELFTAVFLIVAGLSHIARPKAWSQLFVDLLKCPYAGLWIGMLTLPLGLAIVVTHNTWTKDLGVVVTVLGWAWTAKGTLYLLFPGLLKAKYSGLVENPKHFVIAGVMLTLLGAVVLANAWPALMPA